MVVSCQKGWIALDIDGTVTLDKFSVPQEVIDFLRGLQALGWGIVFATGRSFAFASKALSKLQFDHVVLAQNGSIALEMPTGKILFKKEIPSAHIALVEECCRELGNDILVYSGYERGDFCFWRPERFSKEGLAYVQLIQQREHEKWKTVDSFQDVEVGSPPLIKCFGDKEQMDLATRRFMASGQFQVARIRDPFVEGVYLLLVTDKRASKGESLLELFRLKGRGEMVIAAGDDENDLPLLEVADLKIAMAHAPECLKKVADLIAPPTKDLGIIEALKSCLKRQ